MGFAAGLGVPVAPLSGERDGPFQIRNPSCTGSSIVGPSARRRTRCDLKEHPHYSRPSSRLQEHLRDAEQSNSTPVPPNVGPRRHESLPKSFNGVPVPAFTSIAIYNSASATSSKLSI